MSITQSNASISHTYGNVACVVMDYVKGYFVEDFFKTTHISTKLSSKQLNVYQAKKEFWKNKKPMIIMRPRIDLDDSSKWYYGSAMMNRMTNSRTNVEFQCTVPMLENKEFGTMIRFGWNRLKVTFDVAIVVDTYNKQLDIAHALQNQMVPNTPYPLQTALESYIPNSIIYGLADHLGVDRTDIREILFYLNTYAGVPVTYKLKNGSGNNEFFMLYDTNIELITSEITIDDGEGTGMVQDTYTISFSVSAEFNGVGTWYLFLQNNNPNFILTQTHVETDDDGRIIPISSIPLKYDLKLTPGWEIYNAPCYFVDSFKDDITDLSTSISKPVANLIRLTMDSGMALSDSLVRFECFKDTKRLKLKEDFDIEIKKDKTNEIGLSIKIITHNCTPKVTYRLFILVNNFAVNNIASDVTGFNKET